MSITAQLLQHHGGRPRGGNRELAPGAYANFRRAAPPGWRGRARCVRPRRSNGPLLKPQMTNRHGAGRDLAIQLSLDERGTASLLSVCIVGLLGRDRSLQGREHGSGFVARRSQGISERFDPGRQALGARYRRLARRMPKKKALVATGNSMLTIMHALLADPEACYQDLGADYCE